MPFYDINHTLHNGLRIKIPYFKFFFPNLGRLRMPITLDIYRLLILEI